MMPRTSTPNERPAGAANGFTLVELLVVLFILSLASAMVVLNNDRGAPSVRLEANRLAAGIAAARGHAIVHSRAVSVQLEQRGYRFEQRRQGTWLPIGSGCCAAHTYPDRIRAMVAARHTARIVFDPSGLPVRPSELSLSDGVVQARLAIDAAGNIDVES